MNCALIIDLFIKQNNQPVMRNVVLVVLLFFSFYAINAQPFEKLIGNSGNNRLGKMILHNNHYYVLGQNGNKATVTKMGLNGNVLWTNQTNEDGLWNDVIVNKDGNLMAVGYQGTVSNQSNMNSSIGIINAGTGNISVRVFNFGFRDFFSKIFFNPVPSNLSFPYYIIGLQIDQNTSSADKMSVNMASENGVINTRIVISGPQDLQTHEGLWINSSTGDFALSGNKLDGNIFEGAAVNFDRNATSTFMTEINKPVRISNILQNGSNFIYSGQTTDTPQKGLIWKQVGNTNFCYTVDGIDNILNIFLNPSGTMLYALGTEDSGSRRRILLTFDNTQNALSLISARVFENGETSFGDGYIQHVGNQVIVYTDTRTSNPNSFGLSDGLAMVTDFTFQNCLSDTISGFILRPYEITTSIGSVTNVANTAPNPQILSGTLINYDKVNPCAPPCNISLQVNKSVDACSNATFTGIATGGTGPYTYQWDISCNGVNGTTNPFTTQIGPGTIPFCVTVTDATGCTAVLSNQTVVGVRDLVKPEIICPDDMQLTNNPGQCYGAFAPVITVTDNCDPAPVCNCIMTGSTTGNMPKNTLVQFNVGTTTVTCTATDASGNVSDTCTFTVIVLDTQNPNIVCPPNITVSCEQNVSNLMLTGQATATDNCPDDVIVTYTDSFNGNACSGTITRTWKGTDEYGNMNTCIQTIVIEDDIAPAISCPAFITINCDQQPLPALTGTPQVVDNCQQNITPTYTDNIIGTGCDRYIQRIWTADDGCGFIATCTQNIYFKDQAAPSIICPANLTIACLPADWLTANFGTATGTDNCGSVTISNFERTFTGSNCNGTVTSKWRAIDPCGIQNECLQTITVMDNIAPMITCPPNLTLSCNANTTPSNTGMAQATDNCTSNITIRHTDAYTAQGCRQDLIRTWTATDACGNVDTCVQIITLLDDVKPTITCPPNVTISCGSNSSSAFTGEPVVSDFCQTNLNVIYQDVTTGPPCDVTISRTWTVNDGCGNIDSCIQTIKIQDKTPPTFICPTSNVNPIECTSNPSLGVPTNVADNCGGKIDVTKVDVFSANGCFTTLTRTWTFTDQCGNSATCDQVILMQDTQAPAIKNCGRKFTVQGVRNPDGICYGNVTITTPSASDMCDGNVTITNSFNDTSDASATNYPVGQTIVTWTVKDDCGLMAMCQDTVVVLECTNCCWDSLAFAAIVVMDFNVIRDECSIHISHPGLSPCQRVTYTWATGVSTGYLTGTANASHNFGISGDYTVCALIEEVDASGMICFSSEKCYDVCVTCDDGCTDDRIVYQCHDFNQVTRYQGSRNLTKYDLVHSGNFIYIANSKLIGPGDTDITVTKLDATTCGIVEVLELGGLGFDEASSIIVNSNGTKLIVAGIFESPSLTIPAIKTFFGSNITLTGLNSPGIWNGFLMQIDIDGSGSMKVEWAFSLGYFWRDNISDVAVDNDGNIYIVGTIRGQGTNQIVDFNPRGTSVLYATDVYTGFVAKYDENGMLIWYDVIQPYGLFNVLDGNANIGCNSIDIDGSNIYVGGLFQAGIPYVTGYSAINLAGNHIITLPIDANDSNKEKGWSNFVIKYDAITGGRINSADFNSGLGNNYAETNQIRSIKLGNNNIFVGGSNFITQLDKNTLVLGPSYNSDYEINDLDFSNNMLYTIGTTNIRSASLDFISAMPTSSLKYDIPLGVYDENLILKKSIILGGNRIDFGYGIEVNGNDIYIQGISQSQDFIFDPSSQNYDSATSISDEASIFIGKYSCACDSDTDCCDDLSASFSGQDTCCKSLDLVNNAGFDICKVTVELTTPGWILNTSSTATGYNFNPITNGIEITHTSGSLPTGTLNNLVEFCLSGSGTTLSTTQQFIVNWYENTTSGNKLVSCTDSLAMTCDPPPPLDSCVVLNVINIVCDSLNPNVYNVTFTVTNHSNSINATTAFLTGLPSGFSFIPCPSGTFASDISIPIFPSLAPGMTSDPLCFQIYSVNPILNPTDVCFEINLKGLDGNYFACCEESEEQCVTLTPCCQPCDNLEVSITATSLGSDESCCYGLSLNNQCSFQYFTRLDVNILTPNVHFGFISPDANWSNCTPPTLQNICLEPNSGTIGSGNFNDVLQFCLTNVTSLSQVPQEINVKFYTSDINGLDSLACDTLIYLECPFKPTTNDSCVIVTNSIAYCDPETNKYNVSMTIMNNSNPSFCAQELVINLLEPGVANPSAIQLSDPLCYGESVTINFMLNTNPFPDIDGLMPLIISMKNLDGTCCRGGLAYIDTLVLPECPCTTTCCDSEQNEDFENYALGNLPNNQVGWVNNQGNPQVVAGGANGSGKSISLHAGSRGVRPASVSYGNSGVVGPDTIFQANKQYCITFWAKLLPVFNLNGRLGIYADGQLLQTIIIPPTNISWTQYSFNFISPPPGQEILIFTNESPAPTDAGPGILLDQICFDEVVQIFDDLAPPVLSCPMDLTIHDADSDCSITYTIPNITVTDPAGVGLVQCYLDGTLVPKGSTHNLTNVLVHTIQYIAEDVCGNRDSCSYNLTVACDTSCCFSKQNFVDVVESAVTYTIDNSICKVTINIDSLPNCDYIEGINWGDGTSTAGPFTGGDMLMHNYSGSGTYIINMLAIETNPTTGFICFEYSHTINVTLQCQSCICPSNILPFTITHNNVRTDVKCGETIDIKCPVTSIFVTGMLNCQSTSPIANCPPNAVTWNLDRPNLPNLSGTIATGNISVMLTATDVSEPGLYAINFTTICPGSAEACTCVISWMQEDCDIDTCCNDMQAFFDRCEDAVHEVADLVNCKIILNIDSLSSCDSIERIIWGDGTVTQGTLAGGQMYMHNYTASGVKNVVIWFNAFNNQDSVCLRYKVEKSLFLNCNQDTLCTCNNSFNHTYFKPINGPIITASCNGNPVLIPCAGNRPLIFHGSFNCSTVDCPPSNLTYKIVSVSTGFTLASGTLSAPNFSIPMIGAWFDPSGGLYYIELTGQCGTTKCTCIINFKVPPCPQSCLCDPTFNAEVGTGFYTNGNILTCNKKFTPKRLCPKDMVIWTLNGNVVGNTTGLTSSSFVVNPGFNTVCMIVDRMDSNNKICRDTICQRVYCIKRLCPPTTGPGKPTNGDFELSIEGSLPDVGVLEAWTLTKGTGYVFGEEGVDNANVLLTSKLDAPAELKQECCLGITNTNNLTVATLDIQNFDSEKVPPGTTLNIIAQEFENGGERVNSGSIDLSDLSFLWDEVRIPLVTPSIQFPYLIIQIANPNSDEANIRIDNLCFDYVSGSSDITTTNFSIYPNPTTGQLTIQFSTSIDQDISLKVLDILGRQVNNGFIQKGSSSHNFSIDDMAGIYIIQLTDSDGNMSQRKVIKIE